MAIHLVCDGCGIRVIRESDSYIPETERLTFEFERVDGFLGGELPGGLVHWCAKCARIAFQAVKAAHLRSLGLKGPNDGVELKS